MRVDIRATPLEKFGKLRITESDQLLPLHVADVVNRKRYAEAALLGLDDPWRRRTWPGIRFVMIS